MRRRGFVMIIALVYAAVLAVIVMAMAYFIVSETRGVGFQLDDTKAFYLAQAGVDRAFREISDEVLTPPQAGTADLRGATTSGTAGNNAAARDKVRYCNENNGTLTVVSSSATGSYVILSAYDVNYLQARIRNVKIGCRYAKASSGGGSPTLEIFYTTNGTFPQAGNSQFVTTVTSASYNTAPFVVLDITNDRTWNWATINNPNFQIRARGYGSKNSKDVIIDYLFLQVTYDIDTNTEPWYTGGYAVFPLTFGDGGIKTVTITDEARKVHLNTASQPLLDYLMQERGIPAASTIAANIVNYRGPALTNPFDTAEELQQVTGMTPAYYDLIKDHVTVYSYVNTNTQRPTNSPLFRAPVNINTASHEVLSAIFDPVIGMATSHTLANDIITARTTGAGPFTCFYSSNTLVTTDFYDFVMGRGYLTAAQRNQILDNADASLLVPVSGYAGMNEQTTEFCYAGTVYRIESVGSIAVTGGDINIRAATVVGNDNSRTLPVYANQPQPDWKGYWKESYE